VGKRHQPRSTDRSILAGADKKGVQLNPQEQDREHTCTSRIDQWNPVRIGSDANLDEIERGRVLAAAGVVCPGGSRKRQGRRNRLWVLTPPVSLRDNSGKAKT
jgi:hypothetical protein